jgi:hypothetical protein
VKFINMSLRVPVARLSEGVIERICYLMTIALQIPLWKVFFTANLNKRARYISNCEKKPSYDRDELYSGSRTLLLLAISAESQEPSTNSSC